LMNPPLSPAILSEIISFGLWMRKEGYRESTIRPCIRALRAIAKRTNLLNPEAVKSYLASAELSENRKEKLMHDLSRFYKWKHIPFQKPTYRRVEKLPFIPLESKVDRLISGLGSKTATFLQVLKKTGMRSGEAWNLRWTDIDYEKRTVNIAPEKSSRPRQPRVSDRLIAMISDLPHRYDLIFHNPEIGGLSSFDDFSRNFTGRRKNIAKRLQNPRIARIGFKILRHFKASMEYHKTKDILHVMRILGHKNIRNTLVYTHLVDFGSDEYVCKIAKTVDDARILIEDAFEYVTDMEGMKLFRKRK
jgi:integrase